MQLETNWWVKEYFPFFQLLCYKYSSTNTIGFESARTLAKMSIHQFMLFPCMYIHTKLDAKANNHEPLFPSHNIPGLLYIIYI